MFETREQFAGWETKSTNELLRRGNMDLPKDHFSYPTANDTETRIQQLWTNTLPAPVSSLQAPRNINRSHSLPKPVTGIRTSRVPMSGNNLKVTVHFNRVPDPAYQSASVYIKQGNGTHQLLGTTSGTQASFVVPRTGASSVVTVQSIGVGNVLPVEQSPSRAVNLL